MEKEQLQLSKNDVLQWKAIAILLIMLNNFCHHYPSALWIESEKWYNGNGANQFLHMLLGGQDVFWALFSYFGHFGVPIFLFLSGYGLVRKYEQSHDSSWNASKFMMHNIVKMYKLIVPIIILCLGVAFYKLYDSSIEIGQLCKLWIDEVGIKTLETITFTNGLFMRHSFAGAWWFIPMIIQCYLCFIVFHRWKNKYILVTTVIASIVLQIIFTATNHILWVEWMHWNCFGWLLPFTMGIWAARYEFPKSNWLSGIAWMVFLISGFWAYSWIIQSAFLIMACFSANIKISQHPQWLIFIGCISPYVFVTHSFVRNIVFKIMPSYLGCVVFIIVSFTVAIAYKYFCNILYNKDFKLSHLL